MKQEFIDRINELPDLFLLQGVVQFKYVTGISLPNDTNFSVDMSGGGRFFGKPAQYDAFMNKYLIWLETR